jgi:hypothetical protein
MHFFVSDSTLFKLTIVLRIAKNGDKSKLKRRKGA